jgi:hypothetical protein
MEVQDHVFQTLKSKLTNKPLLQYPDFTKDSILTTDASNGGLGAVLSQGNVEKDLPIAYASRSYRMGYKIFQTLFVWAKV